MQAVVAEISCLQLQKEGPLLVQKGHSVLSPYCVRLSTRASHWCRSVHTGQPPHSSHTRSFPACLWSSGWLPLFLVGCHRRAMLG